MEKECERYEEEVQPYQKTDYKPIIYKYMYKCPHTHNFFFYNVLCVICESAWRLPETYGYTSDQCIDDFFFNVMWFELMMTCAITCPLWSSVYECHTMECVFTSPVRTKCGMFVSAVL